MKINLPAVLALTSALLLTHPAHAGSLGADVNADVGAFGNDQMSATVLNNFAQNHTVFALPMYNQPANDHVSYWDNMVEQYEASQIDFIAVWLKGNNQPATFSNFVTAVNKRQLSNRLKIMPFDDNPASWTAMWNYDHGNGYSYKQGFDVSNQANWAYVWDKNLKPFFQAVPDANRYKINGRPVYAIWSAAAWTSDGHGFLLNVNGNGSKLINYLRQQCQATFGFNPYIMVSRDWVTNDPSSNNTSVVDAVYPWFQPNAVPTYASWNVNTWNGVTTGTLVPQYYGSDNSDPNQSTRVIDPNHGNILLAGLNGTIQQGNVISTFIEGFDDYWENTMLWRARNVTPTGTSLGYTQTYFDYPNQRLNIVRSHSNNPFPVNLKAEAEGADYVTGGISTTNNTYRNGNISVQNTTDTLGGWNVCSTQPGQVLQWLDVPLQGTIRLKVRAATALAGRKLHFVIDSTTYPAVNIPNTGGWQTWTTVDMGQYTFPQNSTHGVKLVWDTSDVNVNWWQIETVGIPNGNYKIVARQGGNVLSRRGTANSNGNAVEIAAYTGANGQKWNVTALGGGKYAIRTINTDGTIGRYLNATNNSPENGTLITTLDGNGLSSQQWALNPQADGFSSVSTAQAKAQGGYDVLDGAGCSGAAGTDVLLWGWGGYPNSCQQEWSFVPVDVSAASSATGAS